MTHQPTPPPVNPIPPEDLATRIARLETVLLALTTTWEPSPISAFLGAAGTAYRLALFDRFRDELAAERGTAELEDLA